MVNRLTSRSARGLGVALFGRLIKQAYCVFSVITADGAKFIENGAFFEFVGTTVTGLNSFKVRFSL